MDTLIIDSSSIALGYIYVRIHSYTVCLYFSLTFPIYLTSYIMTDIMQILTHELECPDTIK